jgi:hypothetical protein
MHYSTLGFELQLPAATSVFSPQSLYHKLRELTDLRGKQGRKYELALILTLAILAKLCEQNQLRALTHWAALRLNQINGWFGLNLVRLPHPTTWSRILANAVDPTELTRLVAEFFESTQANQTAHSIQSCERGATLVVLDGKTLRGTIPAGQTRGVHLVAAYLPQAGLVASQLAVLEKATEITMAPTILAALDLRGKVVAGDAMYAQKKLSGQIVANGGDYLWLVKGNQPGVYLSLPKRLHPVLVPIPLILKVAAQFLRGTGGWRSGSLQLAVC